MDNHDIHYLCGVLHDAAVASANGIVSRMMDEDTHTSSWASADT